MIVAVPCQNEEVYSPFDKAKQFKFYEVIGRRVSDTMYIDTEEEGPYAAMRFLKQYSADVMLCTEIDEEALLILDDNGIMVYKGIEGSIDDAVYAFLYTNLVHEQNKVYAAPEHDHDHTCSCGHEHHDHEN